VKAVNTNFITLMTNSFGRGTDFILLDENIKNRGGLHVIHAFLSHDESEEIQIKGRTARQSNSGSYDCVLKTKFLEQLDMKMGHFSGGLSSTKIH
jgi:preprotein translocase subunit SecA